MWMTSCTGSARGGFWGFWKKWVNWVSGSEEDGWLSLARWSQASGLVAGATRSDGKASIERLCLSPYVEKPLNSKVIKSFIPELRSRKCFSCFGIPMFCVYMLRTFYVRFTYLYHGYGTYRKKKLMLIFVVSLFKMAANQSVPGLNRGLTSNFWWLRIVNRVRFTEECDVHEEACLSKKKFRKKLFTN